MNCATPCAPLRLPARGLNRLSCQIRRVKNSIGRSLAAAADCTAEQMDSRVGGSPGADGGFAAFSPGAPDGGGGADCAGTGWTAGVAIEPTPCPTAPDGARPAATD